MIACRLKNLLWLMIMLYGCKLLAMDREDRAAAIEALANLPKINNRDLAANPDFKEILNVHDTQEDGHGESYFLPQSANNLIKTGITKEGLGQGLSMELQQHANNLNQQAIRINEQQIRSTSKDNKANLQIIEIINKNLLDLDNSNVPKEATEPAVTALNKSDEKLQQELGLKSLAQPVLRRQYKTITKNNKQLEEYETSCSTTLLPSTFSCTKNLVIEVAEQADLAIKKRITATFRIKSYNHSIANIDFKHGIINKVKGDHITVGSKVSGMLSEEFGADTIITKISEQAHAEDGSNNNLDEPPTFQNGFVATYSNYQPGADDYDWYSSRKKKKQAKAKRNLDRGATLQYEFTRMQPQRPMVHRETWQSDCADLEDLTLLQECSLQHEVCLEGPETRQFGSRQPYLMINRPCWKKQLTYSCKVPQGDNDCDKIPVNCMKIDSAYEEFLGQKAVVIHKFKCSNQLTTAKEEVIDVGFAEEDPINYQKNTDFGKAVTGLSLIKEITNDVRQEGRGNNGKFFNGKAMHCTCKPKNCCADKKGFWRRMTGCKNHEIQLAEQVKNGNCHLVGRYQVKNSLLQKIGHVDKQGFCCYQSKLSRVIQEGAKQQLNRSWGIGKLPQCEALAVTDLEKLNWDQIDFSEIIEDFSKKAKNFKTTDALIKNISNNLTQATEKIKKDYSKQLPDTESRKQQTKEMADLSKKILDETNKRKIHNAKKHKEGSDEKK